MEALLLHTAMHLAHPSPYMLCAVLCYVLCAGDRWRINFSRVHYNVTWSDQQQRYVKEPTDQPGYNFVWSPQWQVQMHQPETWGFLQFTDALGGQAGGRVDGQAGRQLVAASTINVELQAGINAV